MKVIWIEGTEFPKIDDELCLTIGNFDGLHLGHQELINKTKKYRPLKSAVLTFYPHPFTVLKGLRPYRQLAPIKKKEELIEGFGVDYLFIVKFNMAIANMHKEEFMQNLLNLGAKHIVCGHDFTFAFKAEGSKSDLLKYFEVTEIGKYQIDNVRVSTTYIKELLSIGDIDKANLMLNRKYSIKGIVIGGKKLGNTIGFPTANLDYGNYFLPKNGVYAVYARVLDKNYLGMVNIGYNPTVEYSEEIKVEVNLYNFDADIYGKEIEIAFLERIRPERKFNGIEDLKNQLESDRVKIKKLYPELL